MDNLNLKKNDIAKLSASGIDIGTVNSQFEKLIRGNIPVKLIRPASIDDGIIHLSKEERKERVEKFSEMVREETIVQFIPASGAATRMFGELKTILNRLTGGELSVDELLKNAGDDEEIRKFNHFFRALNDQAIPFSGSLRSVLQRDGHDPDDLLNKRMIPTILEYILDEKGLGYGTLPKALVKFHKYLDMEVTPVGEHFMQVSLCSPENRGRFSLHFTIPEEFSQRFGEEAAFYNAIFRKKKFRIRTSFSYQEHETDTIALNGRNEPVRDGNGDILLRAGGHGSLLGNLNRMTSDIICIRNIDNLTAADRLADTVETKKILITFLIEIREKVYGFMRTLPRIIRDGESINEIYCFSKDVLNISFPADFIEFDLEKKRKILLEKLDRPIRVCGMVKNENEPGGGPFWIEGKGRETILQIVEQSQTDTGSPEQNSIFARSLYFNPVDIVCSIRDHRGKVFDLRDFQEESRYFISEKTISGETVSVLEHPGLWNGSMEKWISLFLEVPLSTFNPVKYVNDLLKENHIPGDTPWMDHIP